MKLSTTHQIVIGSAAALLILVLLTEIAYRTADTVGTSGDLASRAQSVLLVSESLAGQLRGTDLALRAMAESATLEPTDVYLTATSRVRENVRLLDAYRQPDLPHFERFGTIASLVDAKLEMLDELIESPRQTAVSRTGVLEASESMTARLHQEIQQLQRGELQHLTTLGVDESVRAQRTKYSILVVGVGAIVFLTLGASLMIGDLRGRKRAQAALRASEQQFRTLAANAPIGILLTRPGGELDFTNDRYSAITGLTLEDVSGKIWADVLHPDDRESVLAEWRLASTEGRDFSSEYRAIRPDGRVIWIHGRSAALRHEDGSITGFVGTVTDITHRKLAESERDRFFNLSLDMLSICDFHGKLRRFNPAWSDTLGSNVQELETVRLIDLVHEDDRAATENEIARLTRGGSITRFENRLRTRNGSYRWLSWNAASDMDHKLIYAIARDVTDARQLQEQLREKNRELERQNSEVETATRLKSKFLANMSHELRTPLNGIIGFAELMRDGHAGPTTDTHEEFLDDILMSSRHLLRLINDILDLSKVEADKIIFQPRKVDLPCLIREVHHTLRELAARNHVQLSLEIDTALTEVELDPDRLKQILYNYLANALKFTDAGGTVVVRANAVSRGMFRLEVEDTGIGVRPEDIPKLFTEFQQLDQSTSKKYQGTGLGLALTKRLVEAQGGSVGVSSRWGEGSTFYAILPIQAPLDGDRAAGRALADARRILVVGRREILNASFCDSLRGMSIDTRIVDRGTEAMEVTSTEDFDAIVLDVEVPDMDALELLRAIRATDRHKATPVIALTPTGQTSRALGLPVQGSVEKPLDPARLVAALERAGISTPGRVSSLGTEASRST